MRRLMVGNTGTNRFDTDDPFFTSSWLDLEKESLVSVKPHIIGR